MIEQLKSKFGHKCSGIKVNVPDNEFISLPGREMRLCEAIFSSFIHPVLINKYNLGCPGARRNVGYDTDEEALTTKISENTQIPYNYLKKSLKDIPTVKNTFENILFGITGKLENKYIPDLYIIYTKPFHIMNIIHSLARKEIQAHIAPYSLLSICGNVFVRTYNNNSVNISFGCPESRKSGGVSDNEVVCGIPRKLAGLFLSEN